MAVDSADHSPVLLWILDDDQDMCSLLSQQFQKMGWKPQAFHHPRPFHAALQACQPHLLVLDQLLPDKTGLDVLGGLRRDSHPFPVLMLSALGAPSDRIAGLEAGADDYLAKPFQFRELQLRIERLLRSSAAASAGPPPLLEAATYRVGGLLFEAGDQPHLITPQGASHRLSRGDCALLLAFCRRPGLILSRVHLLQATGSLVASGQSRTIDVRLSRLRGLLRSLTGAELIVPERGRGYRLVADVTALGDDGSALPQA